MAAMAPLWHRLAAPRGWHRGAAGGGCGVSAANGWQGSASAVAATALKLSNENGCLARNVA